MSACTDKECGKSVGSLVVILDGDGFQGSSSKIKAVAVSYLESEWYSASLCGAEVTVVRRLLEELGFKQPGPTQLYEDNMACIYASKNDKAMGSRSKHIDTRIFRLRQLVEDGEIELIKVDSELQVADNLTKALPKVGVELSRSITAGALNRE